LYGNALLVGFLLVQGLDGVFTYIGIAVWGPSIEANPIIGAAVAVAGPGPGLAAAKLLAAGCGITLHLLRVHGIVALLTAFYLGAAILPWTTLFVLQ
jgi:hypothetical protein